MSRPVSYEAVTTPKLCKSDRRNYVGLTIQFPSLPWGGRGGRNNSRRQRIVRSPEIFYLLHIFLHPIAGITGDVCEPEGK